MFLKPIAALLIFFFVLLSSPSSVLAEYDFNTTVQGKSSVWGRVGEKAGLFLKFSKNSKAVYWRKLLDIRLAELKYSVEDDKIDFVEETASRYSTYLGHYTNYLAKKNLTGEKDITLSMFAKHQGILSSLRDKFEYDSAWWLSIQHDINTIDILKAKL
ncbi:MAG: hypothetical protein UX13_C0001G0020 [Candidatus Woesebacteria bacterium GW2011_GWB1_45_5]|uniref:DUF5667 domain-containing protein n=1 Tax=Candidatus Woesebacteria bacterium GW2011_GWB1_45_5 TaxID=1618581 RepID=A0A0G1MRV5_9BACT|nr:MAG: hypothetical protein UX13_C0001G0020 [Candidatus Woesebacteria bacterium GW2011_GWB1_45_5]